MAQNFTILDLIRNDVSHDLDSCLKYSKESGKIIPICYDERNTQLKEGITIKPHTTNIVDGKIKRTDKSMDGSKLERTGECIPCWTDKELAERGVSKEDILDLINNLCDVYTLRTNSFGQAVRRFNDDMDKSSIAVYTIEFQQQAQRYKEGLKKIDAGGTEFYWVNKELDKPGEALKNRLEQYTSETIATENWNQKSKGTYRTVLLQEVINLIKREWVEIKYIMVKCRGNKTTIVLNAIAQIGNAEFVLWSGRYPSAHSGPINDCDKWQELKDYYEVIEIESTNIDIDKEVEWAKKRRHNNPPKAFLVIVNLQKLEERNETANAVYEQLKTIKWNHKIIDESGLGGNTSKTMDKLSGLSGDIIKLDGSDHTTIITKCTKENSVIFLAEEEFEAIKAGKCPSRPQKVVIADQLPNYGESEYDDESNHMSVMMKVEGKRQDARFVEDIESDVFKWYGEPGIPTKGFTYTSLGLDKEIHISISGIDQCYAMENLINDVINPKLSLGKKLYPINLDKISGSPSEREDTIKTIINEIQNADNKSYQDYATAILIGDGKLVRGAGLGVVVVNYNSIMASNWTDQLEGRTQNWLGIVHPTLSSKDYKGNLIPVTPVFDRNPYRAYKVVMAQAKVRQKIDEINGKEDDNIIHQIDKVLESNPVWLNSSIGGQSNQLKSVDVIERVKKISSASDFTKGELNTSIVSAEEVLGISTSSNIDTDNNDKPGKGLPKQRTTPKKKTKKQKDIEQAIRTILGQVPKRIYIDPTIDSVDALCSVESIKNIYDKVKTSKDNDGQFTTEVVERILRNAKPDMEDTIKVFREKVITGQIDYEAIIKVSAVKSNADVSLPFEVAKEMVNAIT